MNVFRMFAVITLTVAIMASAGLTQEKVHWDVVAKIRDEGFNRSQIMDMVGYMSDVLGPRLTASPSMRKAQQWAEKKFRECGLENVVIEKAGEHGVNWDNEYTSMHMLEPDYQVLIGYSKAFTPGTNGKTTAEGVLIEVSSEEDFAQYAGKLRGKFALISPEQKVAHEFTPDARRFSDEELAALSQTALTRRGRTVTIPQDEYMRLRRGEGRTEQVSKAKIIEFLKAEGAVMAVDCGAGRGDDGTVLVSGGTNSRRDRSYEGVRNAMPEVALSTEHYNRICRILKRGISVKLEMDIRNYIDNDDPAYYNVVGEIPGTDLKDEIVIVGGHYDSWHTGTGAVDNASGCAVALEAARILKTIGVQPRRTIRVAFWTYEEGGLNGSREYVKMHFGNPRDGKKPEYDKFSGYFNMDNGAGRFRGINLQGNEMLRPIFEAWMTPFHDLGMYTIAGRSVSGTDHLSFDRAGLNGWQFIQDPIDYRPIRHHTNMDVYDGLIPEDLMVNAVIMAGFAYHAAMRDELLPRKPFNPPPPRR